MTSTEDKWAVVIWNYGRHCDEFNIEEVRGPFTFEEATKIEEAFEDAHVALAPMKERGEKITSKRILKRWRKDALEIYGILTGYDNESEFTRQRREMSERILRTTQELLDLHLIKK